jgi:hypothetical protein
MWRSFVLGPHGEWSEFANECNGLISPFQNAPARRGRFAESGPVFWIPMHLLEEGWRNRSALIDNLK